jgi:ABC-2 type transport system permease protein
MPAQADGAPPAAAAAVVPGAGGRAGVIHDIGYRGYEGERLGRGFIARSLFLHSLRGAYGLGRSAKSKVLPMLLFAVMCLPALVMAIVMIVTSEPVLPYTRYAVVLQAALTIFLAAQAPQSVSRDLRFKTVPLYFSRPLERIDYVAAKYAALAAALFVLLAVPLLIMYAGALLGGFPFGPQTGDLALGMVGAALFALVLAGVGLVIASLTGRRGFGVAGIITVLALSYAVVSSVQGALAFSGPNGTAVSSSAETAAEWIGLFSPITLVDGVQVWALGAETSSVVGPPDGLGGVVFLVVTLALVAGCVGLLMLRYRKVPVS